MKVSNIVLAQAAETASINPGLAAIGYGLGAIGAAIGVGLIWAAVINGTARQPEAQGQLQGIAWISFVLVEVLALIGEGSNNAEIAERLLVSPATARTHVSRIMIKLGARDRAQLVVIAYRSGLVL